MRKLFSHPFVIAGATVFALLFFISLQKTAQKSRVASENVSIMEQKNQELEEQIAREQQAIEYDSSDLAKEKTLRNELLLQKPGEYIIQIPDDSLAETQRTQSEQLSPWQEWKTLLW